MAEQARQAEAERALWNIPFQDLPGLLAAAGNVARENGTQGVLKVYVRASLSRELVGIRSWIGKLERLLALIVDDTPTAGLAVLDSFVADILAVAREAVQDLIGPQPNLGTALRVLVALCHGPVGRGTDGWSDTAVMLKTLITNARLPSGRIVVMDRVRRQVESIQPLSRNDPEKEEEAFRELFAALIHPEGIIGGSSMAAALTQRYARKFEAGVSESVRLAINALADLLNDRAYRCRYLFAVTETPLGLPQADEAARTILKMATDAPDLHNFCHYSLPPLKKIGTLSDLMRRARTAQNMPQDVTGAIFNRLDRLLVEYIDREKLIEKLDDPAHPFRSRTVRLIKFCGSGVLEEGEALHLCRERVVTHLRRAHFVDEFTVGISDPTARNQVLRDLQTLLGQSGFKS
ncbi:MAG: hypothetical protein FD149_1857 [Rhodospirillaceae bacterium]|nr:MAG: hypothetical protein FD149_1857 [Rhodospirillaceae bacterium]